VIPSPSLPAGILAIEWDRRRRCGLAPHPALETLDDGALDLACRDAAALSPAGYFPPTDDRRDPYVGPALAPPVLRHARRTCYIVGGDAFVGGEAAVRRTAPDRDLQLEYQVYGSFNALCRSERFWEQPVVLERRAGTFDAFGFSGYLVGPTTVLTCRHAWEWVAPEPQFAVFDYAVDAGRHLATEIPASRAFPIRAKPRAVAPDGARGPAADWLLLELERPVTHLGSVPPPAVKPARSGRPVYALGHPRGLPLKLVDAAHVLAVQPATFRTDLDTFVGNSGSPVFDGLSHALVGIVLASQKGEGDFEAAPALGCYVVNRIERHVTGQLALSASALVGALAPELTSAGR
jgi:hypothetical protein